MIRVVVVKKVEHHDDDDDNGRVYNYTYIDVFSPCWPSTAKIGIIGMLQHR